MSAMPSIATQIGASQRSIAMCNSRPEQVWEQGRRLLRGPYAEPLGDETSWSRILPPFVT
jgi:hypothetical protein